MIETLMNTLEMVRKKDPSRTAIKDMTKGLSYREVDIVTNRMANQIIQKIGVNQRVVVILPHGVNQILALIAILKSNNCYVPIDYFSNEDKTKKIYSSTQAVMYISDRKIPYISKTNFLDISKFITNKSSKNLAIKNPFIYCKEREAYILHTSGSTGEPKGVIVSIANLDFIIRNLNFITPTVKESRYLFSTPYSFDVSITEMLGWILSGSSVYCLDLSTTSNYKCLPEIIYQNKITHLAFSPSAFLAFIEKLDSPSLQKLDSTVEYVVVAGEKFNSSIYRIWRRNELSFKLINAYGPTEATIYASAHIITKDEQEDIPIGVPLEGVKYIIKKYENQNYGELYIGGEGVSKGYIDTSLNGEKFPVIDGDRYYSTGDIVYYKNGKLYYVGRKDNQIQKNGIRIELGEIEKGIESNSKVIQVLVLQIENQIVAFYTGLISPKRLKKFCLEKLPKHMIPNSFIKLEEFPMTANRKVDKAFLKKIFNERSQENLARVADCTNLSEEERQILQLVSKKLKISIDELDTSKDFFENGGDSLALFTLIIDIEEYYGVSIPMDDFYGKRIYNLARELVLTINKRFENVEENTELSLVDARSKETYSKNEIETLYDNYLKNNNKVISKFEAIHSQRIYYFDNFRNILTSTFEYKNCNIEKIKSIVQQVITSNDLLHSRISVTEKRVDFEITKPNLDIPILEASTLSEQIYLENLIEDIGENKIPTSRNRGGQLAMPIIISNGLNGKVFIQMDHSISDLSSISIIKKQLGNLINGVEDTLINNRNYKYYCEKIREANKRDLLVNNQYHNLLLKESKKIENYTKLLPDTINSLSIIQAPDFSNTDSILYISFKIAQKLCQASANNTLIISVIFNNRDLKNLNIENLIGDCHSSKYLIYKKEDDFEEYKKRNLPIFVSEDDSVIYYRPGFIFNEFYPNISGWRQELKNKLTSISLISLNFIGVVDEQKKVEYLGSFSDTSEFLSRHPKIYITSFRYKNQFYILSNKKIDL